MNGIPFEQDSSELDGIVLRCDGAAYGRVGRLRYGFVATLGRKTLVSGGGEVPLPFKQDSNTAEFYAVAVGVWKLLAGGFCGNRLCVMSDNSGVVSNLNKKEMKCGHHHFRLHRAIHQLASVFEKVTFVWIPRRFNHSADKIASKRPVRPSRSTDVRVFRAQEWINSRRDPS